MIFSKQICTSPYTLTSTPSLLKKNMENMVLRYFLFKNINIYIIIIIIII